MVTQIPAPPRVWLPENLLGNSLFLPGHLVNQRGQTSYEGMGICTVDRWQVWLNSVDVTSGGIRTSQMYQLVPSLDLSKTYTLGVCDSSNNITVVSGVFSKGAETENETTKIEMAILDGYAEVIIGNAGKDKTYIWAALYEGAYTTDTLPPYVPRPYAVELAECQRYYRAFRDVNIPCSNNPEGTYITGSGPSKIRCGRYPATLLRFLTVRCIMAI